MRWVISNSVMGVQVAVFVVMCIAFSPLILFQFCIDRVRERIESRYPDSERARAASYWLGLLAPILFCAIVVCVMIILVLWLRDLHLSRRTHQ